MNTDAQHREIERARWWRSGWRRLDDRAPFHGFTQVQCERIGYRRSASRIRLRAVERKAAPDETFESLMPAIPQPSQAPERDREGSLKHKPEIKP